MPKRVQQVNHLQYIYQFCGKSITETFKYKYYEHNYKECRLFEPIKYKQETDNSFLQENIFNIVVICYYYSSRYKSSDLYLQQHCNDSTFSNQTLLLSTFTPTTMIEKFLDELFLDEEENTIPYKDMYYLWRVFLKKYKLPCISSQTNFKNILTMKGILNIDAEICKGIISTVPITWNAFQQFWCQNIQINDDIDDEMEIDEITTLYNKWIKTKPFLDEELLNEEYMLELMSWMMPEVIIENNKYIYNISCKLWDKKNQILTCLETIDKDITDKYKYYLDWVKKDTCVVSKRYFENIISSQHSL